MKIINGGASRFFTLQLSAVALALGIGHQVLAAPSAEERAQWEQVIHDYLMNNPKVILDAVQKYQSDQKKAQLAHATAWLDKNRDALLHDPAAPAVGNLQGDVTVVEFMDYNCGYCRRVFPALNGLIEEDPNVRLVIRDLPVLGAGSQIAAQAALASHRQGLYWEFHQALIASKTKLNEKTVLAAAADVGLDIAKLKKDMASEELLAHLADTRRMAAALAINGTPAFVVGDEIVRGATSQAGLKKLVEQARETSAAQ